jgi:flagellar hook protein FlgE
MSSSLLTGVSGLIANQRMLDVVGNNLANLNTTAFKASRTMFSDMFYNSIRPAASASVGAIGGTNPAEIGLGVRIAQINRDLNQGNLEETGELLDFAIQGDGMFVLNNGSSNLYTRAGAFALDAAGYLVDPTTGYRVQRFGTVGEPDGTAPGFQVAGDSSIKIPFGVSIPGEPTTTIQLSGNLSAKDTGPEAAVMTSANAYEAGGAPATSTTLLNDLDGRGAAYVLGDIVTIAGTDADGTVINVDLAVGPATMLGDLVDAINANYTGAVAMLNADGTLEVRATAAGTSQLSLSLSDAISNTGQTYFETYSMSATTMGKDGDESNTAVEVFDVRGGAHTVKLTLQKQDSNTWNLVATLSGNGVVLDQAVSGIRFNDDGSFQQVLGIGPDDANLIFRFDDLPVPQTMSVSIANLTHLSAATSLMTGQDGFAPGTLTSVNVGSDGQIQGVATNGRRFPIAQLAMASFSNTQGLSSKGDNYFAESLNSGPAHIGTAITGDRGVVRGGQLESSNVDIAMEFTRLIVAQRAFSANARTITVSSEMLEELTNIVR